MATVWRKRALKYAILLEEEKEKIIVMFNPIFWDHKMGAPYCAPGRDSITGCRSTDCLHAACRE